MPELPPQPQPATGEPSAAAAAPSLDELQARLRDAQAKAVEYLNGWKRAKADYLNLKREHEEHSWLQAKAAVKSVVMNLWVDFFCNLELAMRHIPQELSQLPWVAGVQNGTKQFAEILKKLGFEEFSPSAGQLFSPLEHEAVEAVENSGQPANTILAIVRPGLRFADDNDVIVPARVKVAK